MPKETAYEMGCKNYLLKDSANLCLLVSQQTEDKDMDMNVGTNFRDIVDHRDETISFERAAIARKTEPSKSIVAPATCGAGWYHDAAIAAAAQDAIEARSNPYHH